MRRRIGRAQGPRRARGALQWTCAESRYRGADPRSGRRRRRVSGAAETVLKQFLLQTLPAWQIPREWHFVPALTTTARGKISRAEWRRRFQATEPAARS